jgi:hypothetical protein
MMGVIVQDNLLLGILQLIQLLILIPLFSVQVKHAVLMTKINIVILFIV